MTNLKHLLNSYNRAEEEEMKIYKNNGVENQDFTVINDNRAYQIKVIENEIVSCDCPHCVYRKVICKHMIKVSLNYDLNIKNLKVEREN